MRVPAVPPTSKHGDVLHNKRGVVALAPAGPSIVRCASSRILGRVAAGTGPADELTGTNVRAICGLATTDTPTLAGLGIGGAPTHGVLHVQGARAGSTAGDIALLGGVFDGRSATGDGLRFRTARLTTDATFDWSTACFQIAREVDGTGNGAKVIFGPGWLGFSTHSTGNTTKMILDTAGALILGTDPGGTDIARIGGSVNLSTGSLYKINAVPVVGARRTGWSVATGTATRSSFDTASVGIVALAQAVKALIDDFHATAGHGLIGT